MEAIMWYLQQLMVYTSGNSKFTIREDNNYCSVVDNSDGKIVFQCQIEIYRHYQALTGAISYYLYSGVGQHDPFLMDGAVPTIDEEDVLPF